MDESWMELTNTGLLGSCLSPIDAFLLQSLFGSRYWADCLQVLGVIETSDRRLRFDDDNFRR
jgi:hypothetical protein